MSSSFATTVLAARAALLCFGGGIAVSRNRKTTEQSSKPPDGAGTAGVPSGDSISSQVVGMVSALSASRQRGKILMLAFALAALGFGRVLGGRFG